jgi:hypothetical protein
MPSGPLVGHAHYRAGLCPCKLVRVLALLSDAISLPGYVPCFIIRVRSEPGSAAAHVAYKACHHEDPPSTTYSGILWHGIFGVNCTSCGLQAGFDLTADIHKNAAQVLPLSRNQLSSASQ